MLVRSLDSSKLTTMVSPWDLYHNWKLRPSSSSLSHSMRRKRQGLRVHLGMVAKGLEAVVMLVGLSIFFLTPIKSTFFVSLAKMLRNSGTMSKQNQFQLTCMYKWTRKVKKMIFFPEVLICVRLCIWVYVRAFVCACVRLLLPCARPCVCLFVCVCVCVCGWVKIV